MERTGTRRRNAPFWHLRSRRSEPSASTRTELSASSGRQGGRASPAHVAALIDGRGCRQCDRRWLGSPAGSHRPKRTRPNRRMSRGTWRRPYTQDLHRHSGLFSVAGEPILKPPAQTTIISGQSLAHSRKLASCFSARSASGLLIRQLVDVGFIDYSNDSQDDADQEQRLGSKFSPTA